MPIARAGSKYDRFEECIVCGDGKTREYPHVTCSDPCQKVRRKLVQKRIKAKFYKAHGEAMRTVGLEYYYKNRTQVNTVAAARAKKRRAADTLFRITTSLRSRLNAAIRRNSKRGSAVRDLGCSMAEFKDYIQRKFTDGMTWENYGLWHLDHKKPLMRFDLSNREEFLAAVHYANLQPLWARDNIVKGAKLQTSQPQETNADCQEFRR